MASGGRASKACLRCRKQKTRCYETADGRCLRCQTLRLDCSLLPTAGRHGSVAQTNHAALHHASGPVDLREDDLTQTVSALVRRVTDLESNVQHRLDRLESNTQSARTHGHTTRSFAAPSTDQHHAGTDLDDDVQPPVALLRHVAEHTGVRPDQSFDRSISSNTTSPEEWMRQVIPYALAVKLAATFQEHYGRWMMIPPHDPPESVLSALCESPLLFNMCCLITARHVDPGLDTKISPLMFAQAKKLLSDATLQLPQSMDFFRAVVMVSLWSTSVGANPLSLGWLMSGIALQHASISEYFQRSVRISMNTPLGPHDLMNQCVWNHLCLSHLHHCVGTHRNASVDRVQLERSRTVLTSDHITNFEVRIVAELFLYWIMYEQCCTKEVDLANVETSLAGWSSEWSFLFSQPRSTFLQLGLHFARLIAFDHTLRLKHGSARSRETLLPNMIATSKATMILAMETTDARTKHLSDHVYHMIAFAAVTMCRLLHKYGHQLSGICDVPELDNLITSLATWLHSVGPSSHIANMFGDIVTAYHKKLRPDAQITSPTSSYDAAEPFVSAEMTSHFPGLLPIDPAAWPEFDTTFDWQGWDPNDIGLR